MVSMMIFAHYSALHVKYYQNVTIFKAEYLLPIFLFSIIFGIRFDVGVDYMSYLSHYEDIKFGHDVDKEFLYVFLLKIFSSNNVNVVFFFSFLSFLQIFFIYLSFKNTPQILLYIIFILFTGRYYMDWMNLIRQSIAFCIFVYSIKYIKENKFKYYLTYISIAFLFHKSAIILLLLYPILKNNKDYFKSTSLQLIIFSFVFIFRNLINIKSYTDLFNTLFMVTDYGKYSFRYLDNTRALSTGFGFVALRLIDIIIIFYNKKLKKYFRNSRFIIFYNIYFVGTVFSLLVMGNIILERPILYFSSMKMIVVSYLLYYLWRHKKPEINSLIFVIIVIVYIALFIASIVNGVNRPELKVVYHFFW